MKTREELKDLMCGINGMMKESILHNDKHSYNIFSDWQRLLLFIRDDPQDLVQFPQNEEMYNLFVQLINNISNAGNAELTKLSTNLQEEE